MAGVVAVGIDGVLEELVRRPTVGGGEEDVLAHALSLIQHPVHVRDVLKDFREDDRIERPEVADDLRDTLGGSVAELDRGIREEVGRGGAVLFLV